MVTHTLLVGAAAIAAVVTFTATPVTAGPCADTDALCWNAEAVTLINQMRARLAGLPPLAVGTVAALDNAVGHSRRMAAGGRSAFQHQPDGAATAEIGCNVFVSGENIAAGWPGVDNPAAKCVKQWENSAGHRANILNSNHKETVVGIVSRADGYWCTQTFQVKGAGRSGARCQPASRQPASGGSGGGVAQPSVPPPVPSPPPITGQPPVQPPAPTPPFMQTPPPLETAPAYPQPSTCQGNCLLQWTRRGRKTWTVVPCSLLRGWLARGGR